MLATGQHKPFPRDWRPSNNKLLLFAVEHNQKPQSTHQPLRVFDTAHTLLNLTAAPHMSLSEKARKK